MVEYDRINISEGINTNIKNASKECDICHDWYFLDKDFKYELYLCNGCHDLMQYAMNFDAIQEGSKKSKPLFQNTLILGRPGVVIFADIIKIVTIFIKTITKYSRKVKRIRNYLSKSKLYLYFLM